MREVNFEVYAGMAGDVELCWVESGAEPASRSLLVSGEVLRRERDVASFDYDLDQNHLQQRDRSTSN